MRILFGFVLAAILGFTATAADAAGRVALVFSAEKYEFLRPLDNPGNDAQAVANALEKLGFEVTLEPNRSLRKMRRALEDFREEAKGAEVAFVFFAGHGVEVAGENRLLPIDADASSLERLKETSLPLEEVRAAAAAVAPAMIIALDACRNDPFGAASGGEGRSAKPLGEDVKAAAKPGLGRIGEAENALFVFSAAPGRTAADGEGENSPFSTALAKHLPTDGLEIRSVLTLVQQDVYEQSRGGQSPWVESAPFPKLFFAAQTGELPERERLLLAMADLRPELRDEVERVAAETKVPLAPLYGALIAADLEDLTLEDREKKLAESAQAYAETQEKLKTLASSDPEVTQLRTQAEKSLALGASDEADKYLDQAIEVDRKSRLAIKENFVERTLSEAASLNAKAGVARTRLNRAEAIAALEQAAALHEEIAQLDIPDAARRERDWLLAEIGDLYQLVGDTQKALASYQAMSAAAVLRSASSKAGSDSRYDLAASLDKAGDVKRALGDTAGALDAYLQGKAIVDELKEKEPGDLDWTRAQAVSWNKIGNVWAEQGDSARALQAYTESFAIRFRIWSQDLADARWESDMAVSLDGIGDARLAQADLPGALQAYTDSLRIRWKLVDQDAENTEWRRNLAASWNRIGQVKMKQGEFAAALQCFQANLTLHHELVARDPGNMQWQSDIAAAWEGIGDAQADQGNLTDAAEAYARNHAIRQELAARDPSNLRWRRALSVSWGRIGDVKLARRDFAGAVDAYSRSLVLAESLAAIETGNADRQLDLLVGYVKLAEAGDQPRMRYAKALEIAEAMERKGILAPGDAWMVDELRKRLAAAN